MGFDQADDFESTDIRNSANDIVRGRTSVLRSRRPGPPSEPSGRERVLAGCIYYRGIPSSTLNEIGLIVGARSPWHNPTRRGTCFATCYHRACVVCAASVVGRLQGLRATREQVAILEALIAGDDLTAGDSQGPFEDRAVVDERMEFAILSARVHFGWEISQ